MATSFIRRLHSLTRFRTRSLLPRCYFFAVYITFHYQEVNEARSQIRIISAKNLALPWFVFCCLSKPCMTGNPVISRPRHSQLLTQREAPTREMKKLDKFTNADTSESRTEHSSDFPFGMFRDPVSRHEPHRPPSNFFAPHSTSLPRPFTTT
jgi:hypothetical protein